MSAVRRETSFREELLHSVSKPVSPEHMCTQAKLNGFRRKYSHIYGYIHIHIYIHTYIHIHTYIEREHINSYIQIDIAI